MEYEHTLRTPFVRGLTTAFLVSGMGVQDQVNGLRVTFLLWNNKSGTPMPLFFHKENVESVLFLRKNVGFVLFRLH
jgi:hypothetical protein